MTSSWYHSSNFSTICNSIARDLVKTEPVAVGEWQSQDVRHRPEMATRELLNVSFQIKVPNEVNSLQSLIEPNLPWAEDHFQERVSGKPLNPPPSEQWWPFAQKGNEAHKEGEKFSHTYPERMWPKYAGHPSLEEAFHKSPRRGVRFEYGDLQDVADLLIKSPMTRQAFLPIWFPEDTGNTSKVRVPCTLGYHFIVRGGELHCVYYMRSCDFLRHFRDDVYMAARLMRWIEEQTAEEPNLGTLTMHITSLHIFEGDLPIMEMKYGVAT